MPSSNPHYEAIGWSEADNNPDPRYEPLRYADAPDTMDRTRTNNTGEYSAAMYTTNSEMSMLAGDSSKLIAAEHLEDADPSANNLPFWQSVRRYPRVVSYSMAMSTAILGWGYSSVLVTSVSGLDAFLHRFGAEVDGKWVVPSAWQSAWQAMDAGGGAVGAVICGFLLDRFGRRITMIIGGFASAFAVLVCFLSNTPPTIDGRRGMFLAGKILGGVAQGIMKITGMTYVSENAPTALRGSTLALFPTFTLLGQAIGTAVMLAIEGSPSPTNFLYAFASEWLFSALAVLLGVILPESPAHLVRKGRTPEARRAAKRLYAPHVSIDGEMDRIRASVAKEEAAAAKQVSYLECFRGIDAKRTGIVIFANLLPALFGLDLLSQANYFLKTMGMESSKGLLFQLVGIVMALLTNAFSIWLLSVVGRRKALIPSLAVSTALWTGAGIAGLFQGEISQYVTGGAMVAIIVVCGLGAWPVSYIITGETSSLRMRSKTQAVGSISAQIASVIMLVALPPLFQPDGANLGAKTGFVYTGLCGIAVVTSFFFVPEMKGRSSIEIDHMFQIGLPARKFKSWSGDVPTMEA